MRRLLVVAIAVMAAGCDGVFGLDHVTTPADAHVIDAAPDAPADAGPTLVQQGYLKASNIDPGDVFGHTVAVSADGNTIAVGAYGESGNGNRQDDNSEPNSGAIYVFVRTGTTWAQTAYLKASNPDVGDYFGQVLAMSADGNTIAVGAIDEDSAATGIDGVQTNGSSNSGAVYVFARSQMAWTQQAYVKASNTGSADGFGIALTLSDDGNTLAVGAHAEDGNGISQSDDSVAESGAAYVFTRTGTTWSQQAYLKASNEQAGGQFGRDIALSGDGDTLAVGASCESGSAGEVYVFGRTTGIWTEDARLTSSNSGMADQFGLTIALSSNGTTLAVGASFEDSGTTGVNGNQNNENQANSGAVYVFTRSGQSWTQQAYIKASNTGAGDLFGYPVALAGDGNVLVVGSYLEDSVATGIDGVQADNAALDSGAAYTFERAGGTWTQTHYVKGMNTGVGDAFGAAAAISTDGHTIVVGAFVESSANTDPNNAAPQSGAVYVFSR